MPGYFFGSGKAIATPMFDALGQAWATPTPVVLSTMQDISVDISAELKTLYGGQRFPVAAGQGKGKIDIKAKYAKISADVIGSLFYGKTPTAAIKGAVTDFAAAVPAVSAYTITVVPPSSGTFVADMGIWNASTGVQFKRVASAPAAGQYTVSAVGLYTFAAADAGVGVLMNYEYSATSTTGQVFSLTNDLMGYTPSFALLLQERTPDGGSLTLKLNSVISSKLSLPFKSDDFTVSDFDATALADAAGNIGWICLQ